MVREISQPGEAKLREGGREGGKDISRFFPRNDRVFFGGTLNPFFGAQDEGFSEFRLDNRILVFDAEQVYLMLQVINLKNKEVTLNPKP